MNRSFVVLGALLLAATGCGPGGTPCTGADCPAIGGTYAITPSQVTGGCSFSAYTLPGTLEVAQSADGTTASLAIEDPVGGAAISLSAPVEIPDSGDSLALLGAGTSLARQATAQDASLVLLRVSLSAAFARGGDGRRISGSLQTSTYATANAPACSVTILFSGQSRD